MFMIVLITTLIGVLLLIQRKPTPIKASMFFEAPGYCGTNTIPTWCVDIGCDNLEHSEFIKFCDWGHLSPAEFKALLTYFRQFKKVFEKASDQSPSTSDEFARLVCKEACLQTVSPFAAVAAAFLVVYNPNITSRATVEPLILAIINEET
tara:strand:+ start:167 stop:616 length:450 start_codon:yes stop_codon:yes gene_type:complete